MKSNAPLEKVNSYQELVCATALRLTISVKSVELNARKLKW